MAELNQDISALNKNIDSLHKGLSVFIDTMKQVTGQTKDFGKVMKNSFVKGTENIDDITNSIGDFEDAIEDSNKDIVKLTKNMKELRESGTISSIDVIKRIAKIKELKGKLEEINKMEAASADQMEAKIKAMKGITGEIKTQRNEMESLNKISENGMTAMGDHLTSKLPRGLKGIGRGMKGLGTKVGSIGAKLGGWPMAIYEGVKAMWKIGMAADSFVKTANKQFAMFRGPDIMTKNIKGQFKDFNEQIYNATQNLKVGLNADQIRGLMEALTSVGYNITKANNGMSTYRDLVDVAAKASRILGQDLSWVGSNMGEMMVDFRMSLKQVDNAFQQVAFDAGKSGLSTDRFWSTIKNASASLALYGVTVGSVSKTMKRFTEDQIGGAKDASEAVENMADLFKSGDLGQRAVLMEMMPRKEVQAAFREAGEAFRKEASDIETEIVVRKEKGKSLTGEAAQKNLEELEKLRTQLIDKQNQTNNALSFINKSAVDQTVGMEYIANKAPELLMGMIKRITGVEDMSKLQGNLSAQMILEQRGLKKGTIQILMREGQLTQGLLSNLAEDLQDGQQVSSENKDILGKVFKTNKNAERLYNKSLKGDKLARAELTKIIKSSDTNNKVMSLRMTADEKTQAELTKASEDTTSGIVDQTTSFEDMQKIAVDELKWRAASLNLQSVLNGFVFNILKIVAGTRKTDAEIAAEKQVKTMVKGNEELKGILESKGGDPAKAAALLIQKATEQNSTAQKKMKSIQEKGKADLETITKAVEASTGKPGVAAAENLGKTISSLGLGDDKEIQNLLEGVKNGTKNSKEALLKLVKDKLGEKTKESAEKLGELVKNNIQIISSLGSINSNNKQIADMQALALKADPESMEQIASAIEDQIAGGSDIEKAIKDTLGDVPNAEEIAKAAFERRALGAKGPQAVSQGRAVSVSAASPEYLAAKKRSAEIDKLIGAGPKAREQAEKNAEKKGWKTGGLAIRPTRPLIGEAGPEAIIPLPKRADLMGPGGLTGAPAAGGVNNTYNIRVEAVTKDLGQKLGNAIQGQLYKIGQTSHPLAHS